VSLEVDAEVEKRAVRDSTMDEQEGDQELPDTTVTVEEGVDGLELRMREAHVNERRKLMVMEEALVVVERLLHLVDGRGYERRFCESRVLWADPVLRLTELAGPAMRSADAGQELSVDLGDEAMRERKVADGEAFIARRW
jgi:hypothetical protein